MDSGFVKYLEDAVGTEVAAGFLHALGREPSVSLRYNPSKIPYMVPGWPGEGTGNPGYARVPWNGYAFMLEERPVFTLDPYFHAGAYYVQDSSAMYVGEVFRKCLDEIGCGIAGRPVRVLDLCAAPGGKTTDIAASLRERFGENFILVSNEVMRGRVGILADNVSVWGDPNVMVTNADPAAFAALEGYFDIIVADVPCSGEGMFRKDASAAEQWSEDNVSLCQARQRRIVADVWPSLRADGIMIYSTCTFNRYENDGNVQWICEALGAGEVSVRDGGPDEILRTRFGFLLLPGRVPGEGQYCAAVRKGGHQVPDRFSGHGVRLHRARSAVNMKGLEGYFRTEVSFRSRGGLVIAVPAAVSECTDCVSSAVRTVQTGCAVGEMKGGNLVPSADLALSIVLEEDAFPRVDLDREKALAYLHRDAICIDDAPKGYLKVCYGGLPLGFVKNLGPRCNNLYPQSRRIRIDV